MGGRRIPKGKITPLRGTRPDAGEMKKEEQVMSQQWELKKTDDYTGESGEDVEKFIWMIDGVEYEMDACVATQEMFRDAVAMFTQVARVRKVPDEKKAREWALAHGYTVGKRGPMPREVLEAYLRETG